MFPERNLVPGAMAAQVAGIAAAPAVGTVAKAAGGSITELCVFDNVVQGRTHAHIVLEEEDFVGFLDYRPVFDGHTLVIPRNHYATLAEVPERLLGAMLVAGRRVAAAQKAVLGAQGTFFALNEVVSQSVPHVHLHVVPRRFGDGLRGFLWPRHRYPSDEAAAALAASLRSALPPPA
jgi:histidine triad (HIT) family protein